LLKGSTLIWGIWNFLTGWIDTIETATETGAKTILGHAYHNNLGLLHKTKGRRDQKPEIVFWEPLKYLNNVRLKFS
jgi:hypothetical protein